MTEKWLSVLIAAWLVIVIPSSAYAYLDPVTGSFLIQGIIAGVVAVLAAIRSVREHISGYIRSKIFPAKKH